MKNIAIVVIALASLLMAPATSVRADIVGLWHLDEGSGSTASDSSGNGNDGTLVGEPNWVAGLFDNALDFDGVSDYVQVPDDPNLNIAEGTWEAWINFGAIPSVVGDPMNPLAKANQYWIHAPTDDSIQVKVGVGGLRYVATTAPAFIEPDVWYHVAGTYDGETLELYVDGQLEDSNTVPSGDIDTTDANLAIGTWSTPADFFQGIIDEVRIWDEALSADDISDSASLADIEITKELISPALDPDTNGNGIDEVPMATEIEFEMRVTVTNGSDVDLSSAMVRDPLPAELELAEVDPLIASAGFPSSYLSKGKSKKVFVEWDLDDLLGAGPETLDIIANTDINPGKGKGKVHQEYTSPGIYDLNAGATMTFSVTIAEVEIQLVLNSNELLVEAVGTDD